MAALKLLVHMLFALALAGPSLAKPYFFWQGVAPAPAAAETAAGPQQQQQQQQQQQAAETKGPSYELQQSSGGLGGHLGQLVSHGGSAMRNVVDTVQPDLKNIGKDISEAFHGARETVGKKIEPTLQSAGKTVVPLVKQAQEKVPEALSKVSQQVREVWDKVASGASNLANNNGQQQQQQQPQPSALANQIESAGQQLSQPTQQAA